MVNGSMCVVYDCLLFWTCVVNDDWWILMMVNNIICLCMSNNFARTLSFDCQHIYTCLF